MIVKMIQDLKKKKKEERKKGRKDRGTEQDTMLSEELKNRDEQYNK